MSDILLKLSIKSFTDRSINLFWFLLNTRAEYIFDVYRGNSPSDMELIATDLLTNNYVDEDLKTYSLQRDFFYKVIAKNISNGDEIVSDVKYDSSCFNIKYLELVRKDRLILYPVRCKKPLIGNKVYLYIEKTFGERCPECWDDIKSRSTDDQCPVCFKTGITDGFFSPIVMYADLSPDKAAIQLTPMFELQENQITGWTTNYPPIKGRDLIVEDDNKRWRVMACSVLEWQRMPFRQNFKLERIKRSDVEYQLPLPEDL